MDRETSFSTDRYGAFGFKSGKTVQLSEQALHGEPGEVGVLGGGVTSGRTSVSQLVWPLGLGEH